MTMIRNTVTTFILVAWILISPANILADDQKSRDKPLAEGDRAPSFELADPAGAIVSFPAAARNRPSIILFWATWCPYCKALMPLLENVRQDFSNVGVEVFALNVWEDGDPVSRIDDGGFDFRLLLDADSVADAYGVRGTPGLFVVNSEGIIVYRRRPSGDKIAAEIALIWAQQTRAALHSAVARTGSQ
jgi:thiol-disulfide isomerase/thioredoxin